MPGGKTPPEPLVQTRWPAFGGLVRERYSTSTSVLSSGLEEEGAIIPWSRVSSNSTATRQSGSPTSTTCEWANPTSATRPTRPSAVQTGELVNTPSRVPTLILMERHQLAGSRAITRARIHFPGSFLEKLK